VRGTPCTAGGRARRGAGAVGAAGVRTGDCLALADAGRAAPTERLRVCARARRSRAPRPPADARRLARGVAGSRASARAPRGALHRRDCAGAHGAPIAAGNAAPIARRDGRAPQRHKRQKPLATDCRAGAGAHHALGRRERALRTGRPVRQLAGARAAARARPQPSGACAADPAHGEGGEPRQRRRRCPARYSRRAHPARRSLAHHACHAVGGTDSEPSRRRTQEPTRCTSIRNEGG